MSNIYVLYSLTAKSEKLCRDINKNKDLYAFRPVIEYYRRDIDSLDTKVMYPGYVFVKTEYDQKEFDEYLFNTFKTKEEGIVRELRIKGTTALTEEEMNYFNLLFDKKGILRMSYVVTFNKRTCVVSRGPLKGFDKHIKKVDRHNKLAYLDSKLLGKDMVAGLWF